MLKKEIKKKKKTHRMARVEIWSHLIKQPYNEIHQCGNELAKANERKSCESLYDHCYYLCASCLGIWRKCYTLALWRERCPTRINRLVRLVLHPKQCRQET